MYRVRSPSPIDLGNRFSSVECTGSVSGHAPSDRSIDALLAVQGLITHQSTKPSFSHRLKHLCFMFTRLITPIYDKERGGGKKALPDRFPCLMRCKE